VRNRSESDDCLLYFSSLSHLVPILRGSFSLFFIYPYRYGELPSSSMS
jgi:hypothetical protein